MAISTERKKSKIPCIKNTKGKNVYKPISMELITASCPHPFSTLLQYVLHNEKREYERSKLPRKHLNFRVIWAVLGFVVLLITVHQFSTQDSQRLNLSQYLHKSFVSKEMLWKFFDFMVYFEPFGAVMGFAWAILNGIIKIN